MYELIKDLNLNHKRLLTSFCITYCFVLLAVYIFKPELFEKAFYLPFITAFCLNVIWYCLNLIVVVMLSINRNDENFLEIELAALLSIAMLSIAIFYGYYYTLPFTTFLLHTFLFALAYLFISVIVSFLIFKDDKPKKPAANRR
ncbi:hypothetical protein HUK80_17870 [Flavobacterium sp. MAH-1]|uniref:Uncharacterized protein n=1 Tax=Flavobacterium agri TaxID=2743471 RepID=A0A7Y8Y557_9FLAO|nr:hypothetical protein [Flavobacterium agri]NUY82772.1 hypothetical protein [Flavobacterium agri]NYA72794.1 hypothetical protein [Flavobacterium agri]